MEGHSPRCICLLCVLRKTSKHHKLVVPCRFNLLNSCKFSCDECRFTHYEYDEIPPCRNGVNCRFGPTKCLFLHDSFEGDGNVVENLPLSNTDHAAEEQPAGTVKKKNRKKKKKKNNNESRLVESKKDSQSSQSPLQPMMDEEIELQSGSESEGESVSDSPLEAIQESSPLASVVDEPSPEPKLSPFEKEEMKEVVVNVFSSSGINAQPDTSVVPLTQLPAKDVVDALQCSDPIPNKESIPDASLTQSPTIEVVDAPKLRLKPKWHHECTESKPQWQHTHIEVGLIDNRPSFLRCTSCKNSYITMRPPRNKRPSRHYASGRPCSTCGIALHGTYWSHHTFRNLRCPFKDDKHCDKCLVLPSSK